MTATRRTDSKPTSNSRPSGWYALLLTIGIYVAVFVLEPTMARTGFLKSLDILVRIAPVLVLVTGFIGLSNYFLSRDAVAAHVGEGSGIKGYVLAAIGGIASHGPVYAWYALLQDLQGQGMRNGLIAVFLYNRAIKLPLIPLFLVYFDLRFAVVLVVVMAIVSFGQGVLVERLAPHS